MADILRVTTPLVNKNQPLPPQKQPEANVQFQLSNLTKVLKTNEQEGILQQNNTLVQQDTANALMDMLKDPAATSMFLKSIFLLREVAALLPVNNTAFTDEMAPLFEALFVSNGEIAAEMGKQEAASTIFKGDLFNVLREIVIQNPQPEVTAETANLLKALNSLLRNRDILDSVSNNLQFLSESLAPNKEISTSLLSLAQQFRLPSAADKFNDLKSQAIVLLAEIEKSILFSGDLDKVSSITFYNLSRFNNNPDYLDDALTSLLNKMPKSETKSRLFIAIRDFVENLDSHDKKPSSPVMDALAKIITLQAHKKEESFNVEERVENIIHSILSSPCNYTPLLHFVIPVEFMDLKSFAEIWINPNEEDEQGEKTDGERITHVLLTFEVESVGQFELELTAKGTSLEVALFCPPEYTDRFVKLGSQITKAVSATKYHVDNIHIDKLERQRSLIEVFKSLPYRRAGIDVKV